MLLKAITIGLAIIVLVPILIIIAGYHWSNSTPSRPRAVPSQAVFLRAPATDLPGPPRGEWLWCWQAVDQIRCSLRSKDGKQLFEGGFVPYYPNVVSSSDLLIDISKTSKEKALWSGDTWVPLVYLKDGQILIPAFDYAHGRALTEDTRK